MEKQADYIKDYVDNDDSDEPDEETFFINSRRAILNIEEAFSRIKSIIELKPNKLFTKHGRIIGLQDEMLKKLFEEDRFLAYVYLNDVIIPEGLTAILEKCSGLSHKVAEQHCAETLGYREEAKALMKGFTLRKSLPPTFYELAPS